MFRNKKIILASGSPRRKELLTKLLESEPEIRLMKGIDESFPSDLAGSQIPEYISLQKANAYSVTEDEVLVCADTIIWFDGHVIGKPKSAEEAFNILHSLSGKTHQVITGVTLRCGNRVDSFSVTSEVTFLPVSDDLIHHYIEIYKPFDKAGAYGIQEWWGFVAVDKIVGDYYNIMGLPLSALYQHLCTFCS